MHNLSKNEINVILEEMSGESIKEQVDTVDRLIDTLKVKNDIKEGKYREDDGNYYELPHDFEHSTAKHFCKVVSTYFNIKH